jgi:hypothetical protein
VEQNDVFIRAIALFVHEQDVTGGACVELVLDPEVEAECALHGGIPAGNGQAEWRRQVVDDVLEGVMVGDRGEEVWATREPGDRLTISNVDAGDAVLLEEFEDLGGRFLGDRAGESTRQHAYPDRGECGVVCPILDGLDGCDVVVVEAVVVAVLRVVLVLVLVLFQVLLVVVLVKPRERNEPGRRKRTECLSCRGVERPWNANVSSTELLHVETATHLITNTIPQTIVAELVILRDKAS